MSSVGSKENLWCQIHGISCNLQQLQQERSVKQGSVVFFHYISILFLPYLHIHVAWSQLRSTIDFAIDFGVNWWSIDEGCHSVFLCGTQRTVKPDAVSVDTHHQDGASSPVWYVRTTCSLQDSDRCAPSPSKATGEPGSGADSSR